MKIIDKKEASELIKKNFAVLPFETRVLGLSFFTDDEKGNTTFWFDKRRYTREEVICRLRELFAGTVIEGGQCRISPVTLLWTVVFIEDGTQERKEAEDEDR